MTIVLNINLGEIASNVRLIQTDNEERKQKNTSTIK